MVPLIWLTSEASMAATTVTPGIHPSGPRLDVPAPVVLDAADRTFLLRLAREVVAATIANPAGRDRLAPLVGERSPGALERPAAAFVTIHRAGELRGCVGSLVPGRAVWRSVIAAAAGAADDPRFDLLGRDEIADLTIDVSVLGPIVPLDDPAGFVAGEHGLVVERGFQGALMLPEVATEHGWGAAEMLAATCRKAGLAVDAWRDPATRLAVFRTARFGDDDPPGS